MSQRPDSNFNTTVSTSCGFYVRVIGKNTSLQSCQQQMTLKSKPSLATFIIQKKPSCLSTSQNDLIAQNTAIKTTKKIQFESTSRVFLHPVQWLYFIHPVIYLREYKHALVLWLPYWVHKIKVYTAAGLWNQSFALDFWIRDNSFIIQPQFLKLTSGGKK